MAVLSSRYIILVAIVQNIFYVHRSYNVLDASIMLETEGFSSNNTWLKMTYETLHNKYTPVFSTRVPVSASKYLHYKIKFLYNDNTFGETEWKTLISKNITQPNNSIDSTTLLNHINSIYGLTIFVAITCGLLLVNFIYTKISVIYELNRE